MSIQFLHRKRTLACFNPTPTKEFINEWKKHEDMWASYTYGCFAVYFSTYRPGGFYFSFPNMPLWIESAVSKLNKLFKTFQYEIVDIQPSYCQVNNSFGTTCLCPTDKKTDYEFRRPLFTIKFSEEYDEESKCILQYILHHILRMLSLGEGFIGWEDKEPDGILEFLCSANNRILNRYRAISEVDIKPEHILNLDSVTNVKSACSTYKKYFNDIRGMRQTDIILHCSGTGEHSDKYNVGEFVVDTSVEKRNESRYKEEVVAVFPSFPSAVITKFISCKYRTIFYTEKLYRKVE